ncbi:MAG: PH domain-containing protein [Pseudanabaenaceae cyanobacterium bins.68]|nr:PH domain-containing protein [Pseudanabaenaceae cyanobacterium bins.68]
MGYPVDSSREITLYEGNPAIIGSISRLLIAIFTLGLGAGFFWIQTKLVKYLITNQRVVVESGLFSRRLDTLELYLVDDLAVEKPFGQRLLGTGNLTLISEDRTNPELELVRLPLDVRQLYEQLRQAMEEAKQLRRGYYRET